MAMHGMDIMVFVCITWVCTALNVKLYCPLMYQLRGKKPFVTFEKRSNVTSNEAGIYNAANGERITLINSELKMRSYASWKPQMMT